MNHKNIQIADFTYELPDDRIAKYPLDDRDMSKLLVYKDGLISQNGFKSISSYIPKDSTIVFNNTKVIHARLVFFKDTGARIEIFCLEPLEPADYAVAFQAKGKCQWKCIVGNLRKWKKGKLNTKFEYKGNEYILSAELLEGSVGDSQKVEFTWDAKDIGFGDVLELTGEIPVPPYLNRDSEESDVIRYQTVYSKYEGSVAAPTAGLHFSEEIFKEFDAKGIARAELTLHVGAGTFKPVKSENIGGHEMHTEHITISKLTVEKIIKNKGSIIAVGTTSMRTLESFYWLGVKLLENYKVCDFLGQWEAYSLPQCYSVLESFTALEQYMSNNSIESIFASTQIIIVPGYNVKVVDALVTNFHQPRSTLLLLISAVVGKDWRRIYDYAMENDFRFLSYGDSSILFNKKVTVE